MGRACGHPRAIQVASREELVLVAYPIFGRTTHCMVQSRASSCVTEGSLTVRLCFSAITV